MSKLITGQEKMTSFNAEQHSIVIIPARGGSKGIPRKNLRPIAGYPLIYWSIKAALSTTTVTRVVVTTDDEEIALFANRFGAEVVMRSKELADDATTLDPVILDAVLQSQLKFNESYDYVLTVQPTSPLVRSADIEEVIDQLYGNKLDTVLTVVDDRHLCWTVQGGKPIPTYKERVNRQQLPSNYRETGAVIGCTNNQLLTGTRIGSNVGVSIVPFEYSFDIDNYSDLYVCEAMLSRKKIVFTVVGYPEVGLGHAYRALMLAHELVQYDLLFVCEENSFLAIEYIKSNNYPVVISKNGELAETVLHEKPDLIVNDILDTTQEYMSKLLIDDTPIVNFEDLGDGAGLASLVVNALYPHQTAKNNVLIGPKYFCLRDEFLYVNQENSNSNKLHVQRVLITFGGVDEGNLTARTIAEIAEVCIDKNIDIDVILGPGYPHDNELNNLVSNFDELSVNIYKHTKRISDYMCNADFAITSGGRTVLELTSLHVPMIVICQNERETTHTFASDDNGIYNLGSREELNAGAIRDNFSKIVSDNDILDLMIQKMKALDLKAGKSRVVSKITDLIK